MSATNVTFQEFLNRSDPTFWILPVFQALGNLETLQNEIQERQTDKKQAPFSGLKLLLRVIFRAYLETFEDDNFLRLTEDRSTSRAFFTGLSVNKIPPSCEKANAIKRLDEVFERVYSSKSFGALKNVLDEIDAKFIGPLANAFQECCEVQPKLNARFSKQSLLTYLAAVKLWSRAGDIERFVSLRTEWGGRLLQDPRVAKQRQTLDHYFKGYKIGFSFLWKSLLPVESKAFVKQIDGAKDWEELDHVVHFAGRELLQGLEKSFGSSLFMTTLFVTKCIPDKSPFNYLTSQPTVIELSRHEQIDQFLLWYQHEVVDSASKKIFNGSSAFISLLRGEIAVRAEHQAKDRLPVVRFRHPGNPVMFSYGVLLERGGTISDLSGWMIFLETGGDYAGNGGDAYMMTEDTLNRFGRSVEVREMVVSRKELDEFFLAKIGEEYHDIEKSIGEKEESLVRSKELDVRLKLAKEMLLELIAKCYYEENDLETILHFDDPAILTNNREIDILATDRKARRAFLIECSTYVPPFGSKDLQELVDEINGKTAELKASGKYSGYEIVRILVTSKRSINRLSRRNQVLELFGANTILVQTLEEEMVPELRNRYRKTEIGQIFNAEDSEPPEYLGTV
jgi:hypothetical protein